VELLERILLPADGMDEQIFRASVNASYINGHGVRLFVTGNVHPQPTGKRIIASRPTTIKGSFHHKKSF
jgi:hypothetical protein